MNQSSSFAFSCISFQHDHSSLCGAPSKAAPKRFFHSEGKNPPLPWPTPTLGSPWKQRPLSFYRRAPERTRVGVAGVEQTQREAPRRGRAVLQIGDSAPAGPICAAGCLNGTTAKTHSKSRQRQDGGSGAQGREKRGGSSSGKHKASLETMSVSRAKTSTPSNGTLA